jgi:hypothetical protein
MASTAADRPPSSPRPISLAAIAAVSDPDHFEDEDAVENGRRVAVMLSVFK